jgi:hypothetical protein
MVGYGEATFRQPVHIAKNNDFCLPKYGGDSAGAGGDI